jgi:hypothetical protein
MNISICFFVALIKTILIGAQEEEEETKNNLVYCFKPESDPVRYSLHT